MAQPAGGPGSSPGAPRLLYIAFYFPPTRASGVYRSRATANHFAQAGWDVTVVTVPGEFFRDYIHSYDPSLEATVDERVRVERVEFPGDLWEPNIRRYSWFRGNFPQLWDKWRRWQSTRGFPEPYAAWIDPVVARVTELHQQRPFDMVLATGNPHASFEIAHRLHRWLGVPYAVDYRDSWTLNLYEDAPAFADGHRAWDYERAILDDAARVTYVNEPLLRWHQDRYPEVAERMRVLENGWEPEILGDIAPPTSAAERPLRFGYLGTITQNVPLEPFFDGWRVARHDPALSGAEVHLHGHLGYFPSASGRLRDVLPLDEGIGVSYDGPVRKADVRAVYESLDVLLLMIAGSKYVSSGKVYEYMATGRPIVSVHDPDCAASATLQGYPLWFPARDLSPEAVAEALVAAAHAARRTTADDFHAAREFARRYTRTAQLEAYERDLRSLVTPTRRP